MKLTCLQIPFLHFETYHGYEKMAQVITQRRQPPPSNIQLSRPARRRPIRTPAPAPVVREDSGFGASESGDDDTSEDDEKEDPTIFKRILLGTQKLRSTFQELKGKVGFKSNSTGNRVDLEKGAGTGDPGDSLPKPGANHEPRKEGLQQSNTGQDGKNADLDGAMETVSIMPESNEAKITLKKIDPGKGDKTEVIVIEEREAANDTATDSIGKSATPKGDPATEHLQTMSDQQPESQLSDPQGLPILNIPLVVEQPTVATAAREDGNSNQHVSGDGEEKQKDEGSGIRAAEERSNKGKEKLHEIAEENATKPEDVGQKTEAATEQDSTSRPQKVRVPLEKLDEHLVKGYLSPNNPVQSPLQLRRTLDQYFYTHPTSSSKSHSEQVVYRYTRDHSTEAKIFMVDQLWLWIFNDGTYVLRISDEALTECQIRS